MARILIAIDIPEDCEYLANYGIASEAQSAADYLSGWCIKDGVSYSVFSTEGGPAGSPRLCGRCCETFHGDTRCFE